MEIIKLDDGDKRKYIDLLLMADEQESMIDKYLERGEMFVLNDNGVKAECVVRMRRAAFMSLRILRLCLTVSERAMAKG